MDAEKTTEKSNDVHNNSATPPLAKNTSSLSVEGLNGMESNFGPARHSESLTNGVLAESVVMSDLVESIGVIAERKLLNSSTLADENGMAINNLPIGGHVSTIVIVMDEVGNMVESLTHALPACNTANSASPLEETTYGVLSIMAISSLIALGIGVSIAFMARIRTHKLLDENTVMANEEGAAIPTKVGERITIVHVADGGALVLAKVTIINDNMVSDVVAKEHVLANHTDHVHDHGTVPKVVHENVAKANNDHSLI